MKKQLTLLRDNLAEAWILYTAVDTGIFDYLSGKTKATARDASYDLKFDFFSLKSLLNSLVAAGYLIKNSEYYSLAEKTEESLVRKSNNYIGDIVYIFNLYGNLKQYKERLCGKIMPVEDSLWESITKAPMRIARPAVDSLMIAFPELKRQGIFFVDVGCGRGKYLKQLAISNENFSGLGLDMNENIVSFANENTKDFSGRISIKNADFFSAEFSGLIPGNMADGVMFNNIFHLVGDESSALLAKKACSLLKKGGRVYILDIYKDEEAKPKLPAFF